MKLSERGQNIFNQIDGSSTKMGDIKKVAKDIKKDHDLAMELWSTEHFFARLLAILILDKTLISQAFIDELEQSIQIHSKEEQNQLMEWLMANQLMKNKKNISLMLGWEDSPSALQRRTFWYYQARLRWTGQIPPENTAYLLEKIKTTMKNEDPNVQWAMNFTAGWIGVYDENYRKRCVEIGTKIGLYKDEKVAKGCTPNYLPDFIEIETKKRSK